MTFSVISGTLASAVVDTGTFTATYPTGKDESNFYLAMGHKLVLGQNNAYSFPQDFDVTLGTSSITITNRTGATWPSGSAFKLQLEEQGARAYRSDRSNGALLASATEVKRLVVSMAPDVADADGVAASQSVVVATTPLAVINGALASGGVATMDTPRNVVAAWTGAAVLTITGTDVYGDTLIEVSASGTSHTGLKAFKTITSCSFSANVTSATIGSGNVLGLPVFLPSDGSVAAVLQNGRRLPPRTVLETEIDATRLNAGTSVYLVTPEAGFIERMTTVCTTAITTGGTLTVENATVAVTGLAVVVAAASVGDMDTDQPAAAVLAGNDATGQFAQRGAIEIVGDAAFDSAGALNVEVELNSQGIFQAGIRTANGSTSTTGDVRGTFRPTVDPDGDIVFQILLDLPDAGFTGIAQYAG
jgi:hypothetical protein